MRGRVLGRNRGKGLAPRSPPDMSRSTLGKGGGGTGVVNARFMYLDVCKRAAIECFKDEGNGWVDIL
jgi:hypothetical protein